MTASNLLSEHIIIHATIPLLSLQVIVKNQAMKLTLNCVFSYTAPSYLLEKQNFNAEVTYSPCAYW